MNNSKFTLYEILYEKANEWIKKEKGIKGSIVGNLIKYIEKKDKLRDAQIEAIKIYLWLKEKGKNSKLSSLIKDGTIFKDNINSIYYPGDENYLDLPSKRYINRYLQDSEIRNLYDFLNTDLPYNKYEEFVDNLFEDYEYPNYLFSLPMGAGKTFLIAAFIYIDLYMVEKTTDTQKYSRNFIVLAPSAKKTAILPALKTIKLFDPKWIIPEADANRLKRLLKFEVLDEIANADKLQNQNPNLVKIRRTTHEHLYANVFILNAEKVLPSSDISEEEFNKMSLGQQTRIKHAIQIKDELSKLQDMQIFLDEAHHTYFSDTNIKKLRQELNYINKEKNIKTCIGLSGTPYIKRNLFFNDKKITLNDIQDIVYFYPLTKAINNFLKTPTIKKVNGNTNLLIKMALNDFFENYDKTYKNGTVSKIAFYCSSIDNLNEEILPQIYQWYEENNRDKNEILKYYTNISKKYPIPQENLIHFLNLDNKTSKYRVILLVAVGTEGWDCKSLTSVVLPRQKTSKNFVLQTTCRCLREVDDSSKESALIYLDESNFETLDSELQANYHLSINDITGKQNEFKNSPVYEVKNNIGELKYKNIYEKYIENTKPFVKNEDYKDALKNYNFDTFKNKFPYSNQVGTTTITKNGLKESLTFNNIKDEDYNYRYIDFLYELESSSLGLISCSKLLDYEAELNEIYKEISTKENMSWIINHPSISTYDVCKDITSIFTNKVQCKKEFITDEVTINLLKWDTKSRPTIRLEKDKQDCIFPAHIYDLIKDDPNCYENNLKILEKYYKEDMNIPNKEKSLNYIPYKMDSSYELNLLENALKNMNNYNIEIYYNGYKNNSLESFRIITPYGKYTPDFILIKKNNLNIITKVLLIETKANPFETKAKESFIKEQFLKYNNNYSYIKIGDTKKNTSEYNKLVKCLEDFANS